MLAVLTACANRAPTSHAADAAVAIDATAIPGFDASTAPDGPPAGATAPDPDRPPDIEVPTLETE